MILKCVAFVVNCVNIFAFLHANSAPPDDTKITRISVPVAVQTKQHLAVYFHWVTFHEIRTTM